MLGAVQYKGLGQILFFQVMQGTVHRCLITTQAQLVVYRRRRQGLLGPLQNGEYLLS
jgi:hypothetical protein